MSKTEVRWNEETWSSVTPNEDIHCKTCKFKMKSVTVAGEKIERHTYGNCEIYEGVETKPHDVLWGKAECQYHEPE